MKCFGKGKRIYLRRDKSFSYGIETEKNKTTDTWLLDWRKKIIKKIKKLSLVDLILAVQEKLNWGRNFGGVSVKPNLFRYYKTTHQIELLF